MKIFFEQYKKISADSSHFQRENREEEFVQNNYKKRLFRGLIKKKIINLYDFKQECFFVIV